MLKVLIEKEIRDLVGSAKFVITFAACALLIILTFYVGAARYKLNVTQYEASKAEVLRSMAGTTDWFDVENISIFLTPKPLAALVSGIDNDIGRTAHISGRGSIPTEDSRYNEDPVFAIFRFIDLEFVFAIILSLFAILLGYDSVSGEKERGTLKLSFANPIPKHTYILGKILGSLITMTIAITLAIAIGILLFIIMGVNLSSAEWAKLALIVISGGLFFSAFLVMSIFISSLTHRSSNSFLILLVIWVMCVHIIPRTSVLLAARSVDVLSVDEIAYRKAVLSSQLNLEFREGLKKTMMASGGSCGTDHIRTINETIDSLSNIRSSIMDELSSRLTEQRHNAQRIQENLSLGLSRVSPLTSFSLAAANLAGTSPKLKDRFYEAALHYQDQFGQFIKEKTGLRPGGGLRIKASIDDGSEQEKPKPIDTGELPAFEFAGNNVEQSVKAAIVDMGILSMFNIIFFAGAFIAFVRYDLR